MTEFRAQINMRASHDLNMSFTFTHFPDGEADAEEAGRNDALIVRAYAAGYANGCVELQERDDSA